jgi:hypothetical protein
VELAATAEAGDLEQRGVDLAHGVLAERMGAAQLHLRLPPHPLRARQLLLRQLRVPLRQRARLVGCRLLRHRLPELLPRLLLVRPRCVHKHLAATIDHRRAPEELSADGQRQVRGRVAALRREGGRAWRPAVRRRHARRGASRSDAAGRGHELELKVMRATTVFRCLQRREDLVEPVERGGGARHCWWTGPRGRADDDVAGWAGARRGSRQRRRRLLHRPGRRCAATRWRQLRPCPAGVADVLVLDEALHPGTSHAHIGLEKN